VYDVFSAETEVSRPDRTLLFSDVLRFSPAGGEGPGSMGLLGTSDVVATVYVVTRQIDPIAMVTRLRQALAAGGDVVSGVSELPNGCGSAVRVLGPTSTAVQCASTTAWNAARRTRQPAMRRPLSVGVDFGEGPVIVALPGFAMTLSLYRPTAELLSEQCRVVVPTSIACMAPGAATTRLIVSLRRSYAWTRTT
jgi:hypothetical protein